MPQQPLALPHQLPPRPFPACPLQVHKVAHYCLSKLVEQGVQLELQPIYYCHPGSGAQAGATATSPQGGRVGGPAPMQVDAAAGAPAAAAAPSGAVLELTCNGFALPYDMTLASVRKLVWKRSDDQIIHYGIRNPNRPAPMPDFAGIMANM